MMLDMVNNYTFIFHNICSLLLMYYPLPLHGLYRQKMFA